MLTCPAPSPMNARRLRDELAAAALPVGPTPIESGFYASNGDLVFTTLDETHRSAAEAVLAVHTGTPSAEEANRTTIEQGIRDALATLQTIIDTAPVTFSNISQAQTVCRQLQNGLQVEARILRRLIRLQLADFTAAD